MNGDKGCKGTLGRKFRIPGLGNIFFLYMKELEEKGQLFQNAGKALEA
jgi:hypothetical protein